ncbi:glycoside hydrolase family 20 protein [Arachidicoccus rhizosphaerae]|uniref:glycoside hydrolase family 20 protein n=1 Tax=Arachidicoccus rhizosphaerae TaxID=551991 RepID=UPI0011141F25|nr:family 20 glycosylhydrolase [Arachidicoccus rhizosphaerae]
MKSSIFRSFSGLLKTLTCKRTRHLTCTTSALLIIVQISLAAPAFKNNRPDGFLDKIKDSTFSDTLQPLSYDLVPKPVMIEKDPDEGCFLLSLTKAASDSAKIYIEVPKQWRGTAELLADNWLLPASTVTIISALTEKAGTSNINNISNKTIHRQQNRSSDKTYLSKTRRIIFQQLSSAQLGKMMETALAHNKNTTSPRDVSVMQSHIEQAYVLKVTSREIIIQAAADKGALNGMFTLLQLQKLQWDRHRVPAVTVYDYPRYSYRGLMLDVSRNFFPPMYIKKLLDLMALYKMNEFHWHLTDGAGWRLEIKKYPLLTSLAAFRPEGPQTKWSQNGRRYAKQGDPESYGGYYTQPEAKDIVAYAAQRGINIIPEIEFPGHAEELLHAYPFLSATGSAKDVHELNVCSDSTYTFMENVLTEVMSIFPSTYIHIGGDEASKKSWQDCAQCKELMQKSQIKDLNGLQSYGIHRLEKFLNQHGRQLLGWDEITQGGLAPGAAVMVWRNPHTAIQVARAGHKVIQATSKYLYLDHYQSDPMTEPEAIGGYIPLSKVYAFNPLPEDSLSLFQQANMLGVQANLFTEWVPTMEHADYMLFPRALALAEISWTPHGLQDFPDFLKRMQQQYLLLQRAHVNYCRPRPVVLQDQQVDRENQQIIVSLSSELYQPEIYYTVNGEDPVKSGKRYTSPFAIKGHALVKAAILSQGIRPEEISRAITDSFTVDYHRAIGKRVIYNAPYAKSYPAAADATLTDGITGSLTYSDDRWQGFLGKQMDVTVDMGSETQLRSLDIRFMQLTGPGVYMPTEVKVQLSGDNQHFTDVGSVKTTTPASQDRLRFENYHFNLQGKKARYVRLIAPHDRGFLFTDEIKIY